MLPYFFNHVRLLDLLFKVFFYNSVSELGFRVCLCVHASCMCTQARRMCTYTTSLRMQAYVCACILVPRNPDFEFSVSFALFISHNILCFNLLVCFLCLCFSIHMFVFL